MRLSEQHDLISKALVEALGQIGNPPLDDRNPFIGNRFVSLPKLLDHVRPTLCKHGITVMQSCAPVGEALLMVCTTTLLHTSGQWAQCEMAIAPNSPTRKKKDGGEEQLPGRPDAQCWAGASTYARRYGILAMLGIAGDEDDDGNHGKYNGNSRSRQDEGPDIPEDAYDKKERPAAPRPATQRQWTPEEQAARAAEAKHVAEVKAKLAQQSAPQGITREVVDPDTGEILVEGEPEAPAPATPAAPAAPAARGPVRPAGKAVKNAAGF